VVELLQLFAGVLMHHLWSSHSVPGGKHVSRADQYP
jgi:hypothetical protein